MAAQISNLTSRQLSLPGRTIPPPALPLIISTQDKWNPDSCKLEPATEPDRQDHSLTLVEDALELLRSINKPLAVLSICGPYRSGKSYFISRVLGKPGAFQLGHSMKACTHGIWMATTILECKEFAMVVLDTEGIDAIGVSENFAMSLLTLTTLLSSFLIYNSKKVPQKVDLDKMRCFTQLSTSLLTQKGATMTTDAIKKFFPRFLWLLRDVSLTITNKAGEVIEPTEYLHTRILATESGELSELGRSLCNIFPSLECATLPTPSINRDVIRNITAQEDKLKPAFKKAANDLMQHILRCVPPKRAIDGMSKLNGSMLVTLARMYVEAINTPGAIPDLEQGWQAVIRLKIKECSDKMVNDYKREMADALTGKFPMGESSLMRIHMKILKKVSNNLQKEIQCIDPLHCTDEDSQPHLRKLEQAIVRWSKGADDRGVREVSGGVLFQFTEQNYSESKQQCEKVFTDLMEKYKVNEKVDRALMQSHVINISDEIEKITFEYALKAKGPARERVLKELQSNLNENQSTLKKIPGAPKDVKIVGRGRDRIKLAWKPPDHNTEAVESYVVSKKCKSGEWEVVETTEKTTVLIKGLKSNEKYEFQVQATNPAIKSLIQQSEAETKWGAAAKVALGAAAGAGLGAASAFMTPVFVEALLKGGLEKSDPDKWTICIAWCIF